MANNNNNNNTSTILSEHKGVVSTRYILAVINFVAILLGTLATLYFVQKRGVDDIVLLHIYALLVINAVQIILCITEGILRCMMGIYLKHMPKISYLFGAIWILLLASETVFATMKLGVIRTDLLAVAIIQLIVAIFAYILWPAMDRGSLNAMIAKSIRGNETKRRRRARRFVGLYGFLCLFIVVAQVGTLIAYRLPPKFYDLFAESRALEYALTDDGNAYEVVAVYNGTSPYVNIPATYNNLPVVGIRSGAITDVNVVEKYKITSITFGTETVDANGKKVIECNLKTIADNAIVNNKITSLEIPASVTEIGTSAIKSNSIKTITYSASANFDTRSFECPSLKTVTMAGDVGSSVGSIVYLDTLPDGATIMVDKDIYNQYRKAAKTEFLDNFAPLVDSNEYYIDFYTGVEGYYIDSIFFKAGETEVIDINELVSGSDSSIIRDTKAYIENNRETGTDGALANAAFRGWYQDNSYQSIAEWNFAQGSVEVRQNAVFYAYWIPEYTATLEWDGYKPEGMPDAIYWTDENVDDSTAKVFPVYQGVNGRAGYNQKGIEWYVTDNNGVKQQVTGTTGISRSITLQGDWKLDPPTVQLKNDSFNGLTVNTNGIDFDYKYSYVYDESKTLALSSVVTHNFNDPVKGTLGARDYKYTWQKKDSEGTTQVGDASGLSLDKVYESGLYTLIVEATSPYGDSASTSIDIQVRIDRKTLDIGGATIESVTGPFTYDSMPKMLNLIGEMATGLKCTYTYKTGENFVSTVNSAASNMGVVKAGTYRLEVLFEKSDPEEARNYQTFTLTRDFVVSPKTIAVDHWSDNVVYNGLDQECVAYFRDGDICGDDVVEIVYDKNVYRNASTGEGYLVKAVSLKGEDSANYQFAGAANYFKIAQYEIKVSKWQLDGKDAINGASVTYDGNTHSVIAEVSGGLQGDEVFFTYEQTSDNSGKNVNTYVTTISKVLSGADCGNYFFNEKAENAVFNWEITAQPLVITYSGETSKTYNGGAQFITATISGFVGDDYKHFKKDTFLYEGNQVTDITFAEGANSTIVISFLATNASADPYVTAVSGIKAAGNELDPTLQVLLNNYTLEGKTRSFTISPKKLTVQKTATKYIYNGSVQDLIVNVTGIYENDISKFSINNFEADVEVVGSGSGSTYVIKYTGKNAGSYPITVKLKDGFGNYVFERDFTDTIVIEKKTLSITSWNILDVSRGNTVSGLESGKTVTYNGTGAAAGYTVEPVLAGVTSSDVVNLTLTGNYQCQASSSAYTTSASLGAEYTNYTLASLNSSISWYIEPYQLSFEWTVNGNANISKVTYNAKNYSVVANPTDLFEGDTVTITYISNSTYSTSGKNAGKYSAKIDKLSNTNYTIGANSKNTSFSWEIAKKEVILTFTPVSGTPVYNGLYHGPSFILSGIFEEDFAVNNFRICAHTDSNSLVSGASSSTIGFDIIALDASYSFSGSKGFAIDAGEYTVRDFYFVSDGVTCDNYYVSEDTSNSFSIAQREIKLSGEWYYSYNGVTYTPSSDLIYRKGAYSRTTGFADGAIVTRTGASAPDAVAINYGDTESAYHAGTHTTTVTGLKDGSSAVKGISNNYRLSEENTEEMLTSTWVIVPKVLNVVWGNSSFTYSASAQTYLASFNSVAYTSGSDTDGKIITGDSVSILYEDNSKRNAGSYTAKAVGLSGSSASDYVINADTATSVWSIAPRQISFNWSASSFVYNSYVQTPTATYTYAGETVNATGYTVTCTSNSAYLNATNVGTYKIVVTEMDDTTGNYVIGESNSTITHTFKITKKTLTYSWKLTDGSTPLSSYTYDGKQRTATAVLENVADNDLDKISLTNNSISFLNANTYNKAIDYNNVVGDTYSNYSIESDPLKVTVNKKALSTVWTMDGGSYSYTYHKDKNNTLTLTLKGMVEGETVNVTSIKVTATRPGESSTYINTTLDQNYYQMHDASTYKITLNGISNTENYSFSADYKTVTISQQKVDITWAYTSGMSVSGNTYSATYDTNQKTLTATVKGVDDGRSITDFSYSGDNFLTNAGSLEVKVSALGSAYSNNYTLSGVSTSLTTKKIRIDQVAPTIVWKWDNSTSETSYIYNGTKHQLTATVTGVKGESVAFSTSTSGDFTTPGTHTTTITLSNSNYTATSAELTRNLVINKQTATLSWNLYGSNSDGKSFTYDGTAHTLTVTANANGSVVDTYTFSIKNVSDSKTYSVTDSTFGSTFTTYYTLSSTTTKSMDVTVKAKVVSLSWSKTQSGTYNGNAHVVTATVTNLASGDSQPTISYSSKNNGTIGSISANSATNAGNYTVTAVSLSNSNYTLNGGSNLSYTFEIKPANVASVTWNNSSVTYDGNSHELSATVKGVNGENLTVNYSDNRYFVNAGTHSVTITGVTSTNYTVQGVSNLTGYLTINKRQVGISWSKDASTMTYTAGHLQGVTASATNVISGDLVKFTYSSSVASTNTYANASIASNASKAINAGVYTVTVSGVDNSNYYVSTGSSATYNFTILPATVTVTWRQVATANGRQAVATVSNAQSGDSVKVTAYTTTNVKTSATVSGNEVTESGTYTITATGLNNSNYTVSSSATVTYDMEYEAPQPEVPADPEDDHEIIM